MRRGLRVSGPQAELLTSLAAGSELFVCGAQVGVARSLAKRGLARIEDNGKMTVLGRVDGERWSATLTDAGVQLAAIINERKGRVVKAYTADTVTDEQARPESVQRQMERARSRGDWAEWRRLARTNEARRGEGSEQ